MIHNYRWRLGLAEGEERYLGFEQRLAERPTIAVPTITIGSDFDGANADADGLPRPVHRLVVGDLRAAAGTPA